YSCKLIEKNSPCIKAIGDVDELSAVLSLAKCVSSKKTSRAIDVVQKKLFTLNAELAGAGKKISQKDIDEIERQIDAIDAKLKPIHSFVLPKGKSASMLNFARTVCRRAERGVCTLAKQGKLNPRAIAFLNRLSSLLFVLSRIESEN
ncbi:MAG: cob(I)yrinic acid a,c-diamide adenosyltransferase, partial [Candidatus Micrarchaeota archaeon]